MKSRLLSTLLLAPLIACAQNIGGIVNSYTPVISLNSCSNKITVEDAGAFNAGDTVLLIQMKGAVIDSSNTSNFGNITDYKNAGNYEFNQVKSKSGNIIELKFQMTRSYDIPAGKVQLVRVPYYNTATVTNLLTAAPWDGNKGGVLVLTVFDKLTLQANIDVSGKGFRGGTGFNSQTSVLNCNYNDYYYPQSSNNIAGQKGESIYLIGSGRNYGKGSSANGGGGGLGHNSGGGGGSNAASGGFGGYQLEPCGNAPFNNRGIGGYALQNTAALNRAFLGGGGGAGQADNTGNLPPHGGNGAGIIIIVADKIEANSFKMLANGNDGTPCSMPPSQDCHDAMGGGGGGGSILLSINQYIGSLNTETKGGKGANMVGSVPLGGRIGPGGGGGGGFLFIKQNAVPVSLINTGTGGLNGVMTTDNNNPWGATAGQNGQTLLNLLLPVDNSLYNAPIDSVRIKDSLLTCSSIDFKGIAYTNNSPITSWQWYFGDGGTASTQNTSHNYLAIGSYTVKLVVIGLNGCKDSVSKIVNVSNNLNFDFSHRLDPCNVLSVQFAAVGQSTQSPWWSFGDATTLTGVLNPVHNYPSAGNYMVRFSVSNGQCTDTITKIISVAVNDADIIQTRDTIICKGNTLRLQTDPSLSFCWTPTSFLDNPNSPTPLSSTPQNITYYFTAEVAGNNIISNGNFNNGNASFTSQYVYAANNVTEGQYFVGPNPQAWNTSLSACTDHSGINGNMLLVNGSPMPDVKVWSQTVTVTPNTNYSFSTWIQALYPPNPAQLQFSINGFDIGSMITASLPTCTWSQFYTTWNSGNNSSAVISIVNKNTQIQGNDFALDDISFAPLFIKRDSVKITVDNAVVTASNDSSVCEGNSIQLTANGAVTYSWTPVTGLSNPAIANPLASPAVSTQYIVTGLTSNGCAGKDTVAITVQPKPLITKSNDAVICVGSSTQLNASGGISYAWFPATGLNNATVPNPVASPASTTTYYVTVTNSNNCSSRDSIKISVRDASTFSVVSPVETCASKPVQLLASGGHLYAWQPAGFLDDAFIPNPIANTPVTTTFSVLITDTVCHLSSTLSSIVNILPNPVIRASKLNDIDCSNPSSQLLATGGQQYSWTPGNQLSNPNNSSPVATPGVSTMYYVKGIDAKGCVNTDSVTVFVTKTNPSKMLMPTGFTPNNDGKNDCYGIRYWGNILELEFSIYNRWGERVFFTKNPTECWNGKYKGVLQDPSVFIYMIKAKTSCENNIFRKGTFLLIR